MADGHGGERQGAPGKAYANRSDLNKNKQPQQVATGQKFGRAADQKRALAQMPLPQQPPPPIPGQVVDLFAPSDRPDEPLTAGAPFGAGPGPAPMVGQVDTLAEQLRALYLAFPRQELREILAELDDE